MPQQIHIANSTDIPEGAGREFVAGGRVIAVFQVAGQFYALDGLCPHAGGPIGTGTLRGCVVTCPWHGWQFDVTTGQHSLSKNLKTTTFPLELRGEELWIELPE